MSLDCRRKLEYLEKTHAGTERTRKFEFRTFVLWDDSTNLFITLLLHVPSHDSSWAFVFTFSFKMSSTILQCIGIIDMLEYSSLAKILESHLFIRYLAITVGTPKSLWQYWCRQFYFGFNWLKNMLPVSIRLLFTLSGKMAFFLDTGHWGWVHARSFTGH